MATVIANGKASSAVSSTTIDSSTFSISGSNKYLRVLVLCGSNTPALPTSVVWDPAGANQSLTLDENTGSFNTFFQAATYHLVAPADGSAKPVRVTWASAQDEQLVVAVAYTGVDQTTPHRTAATIATGTASPASSGAATSVSGDTIAAFLAVSDASSSLTSVSATAPLTLIDNTVLNPEIVAAAGDTASGSTYTAGWTYAGSSGAQVWKAFAAALIDASGGGSPPTITAQPQGAAAAVGSTATFSVTSPDATSYQWQESADRGITWASVTDGSGGTTDTFTTASATSAHNGRKYRCVLTNANGDTTSLQAFFHVSGLARNGRGTTSQGVLDAQAFELFGERSGSLAPATWYSFRSINGNLTRDFAAAARARFFPDAPALPAPSQALWSNRLRAELPRGYGTPLATYRMRGMPAALLVAQTAGSATASLGAAIQAAATTTASLGAAVQQANTATASLGAAVAASQAVAASLDLALQQANTATAGLTAYVQAGSTASASLDVAVQQANAATASLGAAVQLARTAAASIDTAVQVARTATASADIAVQAGQTATASLGAYVQAGTTAVASLQVAVQQANSAAASLQVAVATASAATASVGAAVALNNAVTAAAGAAVLAARTATASLGAYVDDPTALVFTGESRARIGGRRGTAGSGRIGPEVDAITGRIGPRRQ